MKRRYRHHSATFEGFIYRTEERISALLMGKYRERDAEPDTLEYQRIAMGQIPHPRRHPRTEAVFGFFYGTSGLIRRRLSWKRGVAGVRVSQIWMTTSAIPTQFEGWSVDGRPIYIRYRGGWLSVSIGEVGDPLHALPGASDAYGERVGHEWAGQITLHRVCRLTGLRLELSAVQD